MKVVKCDLCSFTAPTITRVRKHKLSVHSDLRPWPCTFPGCNYAAKLKGELTRHSLLHELEPELRNPLLCTFNDCVYRTNRKSKMEKHVIARHTSCRTRDFPCAMCPSRFYSKSNLQIHIRSHLREKVFECDLCVYKTHEPDCLRKHKQNNHQKLVTFTCSLLGCHYSTNIKSNLSRHLRKHNPDPFVRLPVPCTFPGCQYRVMSPYQLDSHMKSRHRVNSYRDKTFSCPFCPQKFLHQSGVRSHLRILHLKEKGYHCEKCSYATGSSYQLQEHFKRVHDPGFRVSSFTCESCGYRALSKAGLCVHMKRIHPPQRELTCLDAPKLFVERRREYLELVFKVPIVLLNRINIQLL